MLNVPANVPGSIRMPKTAKIPLQRVVSVPLSNFRPAAVFYLSVNVQLRDILLDAQDFVDFMSDNTDLSRQTIDQLLRSLVDLSLVSQISGDSLTRDVHVICC